MQRFHGTERPTKVDGSTALDIFHVWPDQHVENGVRHRSWVFVYLQGEPPKGAANPRVRLWLPGRPVEERRLGWGEEWFAPVPGWGIASVVADGDVPLEFFWELTPGRE